jgi:MerR family transcriptional regulator, thiopeptide resistance regulator
MTTSNDQFISPAEAGRRLGVSGRALRLYERRGLLKPVRTAKGWRAYGPEQIVRIQEIRALKGLGLSLARIAELFAGRESAGLDQILAAQQDLLIARRAQMDRAITLVNVARARIAAGHPLAVDDLITLIQETAMSEQSWMTAIKPIYDRHFAPHELQRMSAESFEPWSAAIAELKHLTQARVNPASNEAVSFFARWLALSLKTVGGDVTLFAKGNPAWNEALANPDLGPTLPFGAVEIAFLGEAGRNWRLANPQ